MKWVPEVKKGKKVLSPRAFFVLLALMSLLVLSAANFKWGG